MITQRTPVMRGIEPIGNWGLLGVGFRRPNTFFTEPLLKHLCSPMAQAWWIYWIGRYNYSTVSPSSRNLPFSNRDLAQLVLLLRQATKCLYSILPGNKLVLLPLPSQNRRPWIPRICPSHRFESWCCCFEDHRGHISFHRALWWSSQEHLAVD